ncbi:MAG TPA: MFS transporter, partial [Gammaproteobacteria bacterium]|nr:MFS transporter [Gammaproteobacteria bacterium]
PATELNRRNPCPQRDKPWVLATAILGSSLAFIEGSVVNLALPAIQSSLQAASTELLWVVNVYLLMLGSFMLVGGSLGDHFGLRRIFILGTGVFGLGALACAFASSLPLLVAARALQGLGGALLVPACLALISLHFDEHERGRAIGTWAGASALTTALGPVLGGWLVDSWGWPSVFLLMVPLALLTSFLAWWRVPVDRPLRKGSRLDYPGALLLAAALGLFIYALVDPLVQSSRLTLFLIALALGAAFLWREARATAPMLPLGLFRSRAFSGANLMTLLLYGALSGGLYFLPFDLIQVQGYSALEAGAVFLPFALILGLGSTYAGGLIRRFDPRAILTLGPMITALGFAALALPGTHTAYFTGFLPGILIMAVGMTVSVAPLTTVVMGSVSEHQGGIASGVNNTASRLAGVLAVAALTTLAVAEFSSVLLGRLQQARIPAVLVQGLVADAAHLAELKPPAGVPAAMSAAVSDAVAQSYVGTFRLLVLVCAGLAAVSGLIAWFSLAGARRRD